MNKVSTKFGLNSIKIYKVEKFAFHIFFLIETKFDGTS